MAKVKFHPLLQYIRGKIDGIAFRQARSGKFSAYASPTMSDVKWSAAQKAHRERMAECYAYAEMALSDPEVRAHYVRMAVAQKKDPRRPGDLAVSDYYHGNNLLGHRFQWNVERWRATRPKRKRKKR